MSYTNMLNELEANGHLELPIEMVGDMFALDDRIKNGDATMGWRGDPSMGIFVDKKSGRFEVWGIDRGGNGYLAASHHVLDQTLLRKLADGDPRHHDVVQGVLDHNARLEAAREARNADLKAELADKVQWAIRRDVHNGRGAHTAITRKVGA